MLLPTTLSSTLEASAEPLESGSLLWLRDFSPDDGFAQRDLLAGDDLDRVLASLARFHAHFWGRPAPDVWDSGGRGSARGIRPPRTP